jgi:seryl-tRNA synthetase
MLDVNLIVNHPESVNEMLKKRGLEDPALIDKLNEIIGSKKKLQKDTEALRSDRNRISKEIGILKSKGEDISTLSDSVKKINEEIKRLEEHLEAEENRILDINLSLPNFLDDSVPFGKSEEDNVVLKVYGEKKQFSFTPLTHFDIGEKLKIFDFERGIKLAGSRAYTYFGIAAKLERALMNFMLDINSERGYTEVWVPIMVNDESMLTTGQYPKFKDEYYRLDRDNLNLIPTAEVPLTNLYRDEILQEDELPLCVTAHTSCFRREAGSHGRDTRGLVRVHQFQKVELVKFCAPEKSEMEHEKMKEDVEYILQQLGLHYRVMLLCSKDTSNSSTKTYDLEVWMPGLNRFMEISSVSNFKDYQARRGKIRYKSKTGKNALVHTLNGSCLAIGRTLAAIVENYQTENGNFEIPQILKKYM